MESLADLWETAQGAIEKQLAQLEAKMQERADAGEPISESWLMQQERYQSLLTSVMEEMAKLADAAPTIGEQQVQAATVAAGHAERLARASLGPLPDGVSVDISWNALATDVLEAFAARASDGSPLADLFLAMGPGTAQKMRESVAAGIALGENPRDIARRLRGVTGMAKGRAETIARTEVLTAAREATRRSYAANRDVVKAYRRICAGDKRVCAACWGQHGAEYSVDERPHLHPNCRCCIVPVTPSWSELLGDPSLPDTTEEIPDADTLFKRLSKAAKIEVLGETGYDWWMGGVPLSAFSVREENPRWGPTLRVATLSELEYFARNMAGQR